MEDAFRCCAGHYTCNTRRPSRRDTGFAGPRRRVVASAQRCGRRRVLRSTHWRARTGSHVGATRSIGRNGAGRVGAFDGRCRALRCRRWPPTQATPSPMCGRRCWRLRSKTVMARVGAARSQGQSRPGASKPTSSRSSSGLMATSGSQWGCRRSPRNCRGLVISCGPTNRRRGMAERRRRPSAVRWPGRGQLVVVAPRQRRPPFPPMCPVPEARCPTLR